MFDLKQLIKEPTRVRPTSRTLIDHVLVSDIRNVLQSGVIDYGISDHNMIYFTRKVKRHRFNGHNSTRIRSLKFYSRDLLIDELSKVVWEPLYSCEDVDMAWDIFKKLFMEVINKVAPSKKVRIKQNTEPWMCQEILTLIKERDSVFKAFNRDNDHNKYNFNQ